MRNGKWVPDSVVLEFGSELAMLEAAIVKHSLDDEVFDKVVDDVINCIYQRDVALENLNDYMRVLEALRYRHGLPCAAQRFGKQLLSLAEQFGLYLHGVLPWLYSGRCGTHQLILSKISGHAIDNR